VSEQKERGYRIVAAPDGEGIHDPSHYSIFSVPDDMSDEEAWERYVMPSALNTWLALRRTETKASSEPTKP